ncbi:unnamed protein product [Lampetra planeri]
MGRRTSAGLVAAIAVRSRLESDVAMTLAIYSGGGEPAFLRVPRVSLPPQRFGEKTTWARVSSTRRYQTSRRGIAAPERTARHAREQRTSGTPSVARPCVPSEPEPELNPTVEALNILRPRKAGEHPEAEPRVANQNAAAVTFTVYVGEFWILKPDAGTWDLDCPSSLLLSLRSPIDGGEVTVARSLKSRRKRLEAGARLLLFAHGTLAVNTAALLLR